MKTRNDSTTIFHIKCPWKALEYESDNTEIVFTIEPVANGTMFDKGYNGYLVETSQ